MLDGILIIDKPAGFTSHDVVSGLRRILKTKKIGHTGTLDPMATGVLVMLIGKATRLAQFLDKDAKEYEAIVRFGFETETGDATGERRLVSELKPVAELQISDLESALDKFRGEIEQTPPMYSAKKVKGKKLYELARKGIEVERQPVTVNISKLELIDRPETLDSTSEILLRVVCSAGTYIRTLAEDIGRKIGVGAHLAALRRIRAGGFEIAQAISLEDLEKISGQPGLEKVFVSMNNAVPHLPERMLNAEDLTRIKTGLRIDAGSLDPSVENVKLTDQDHSLIGIGVYQVAGHEIQPRIVFL